MLRSQPEQADELPESGPREHDVPFVLPSTVGGFCAHYSRSCPPRAFSCVHVHVHVVLLTLAWSWQLMFRVCAPARAGLLCALRVLFVHFVAIGSGSQSSHAQIALGYQARNNSHEDDRLGPT